MLSAKISGFSNQLFLQNESMKWPHFLHVIFGWAWSKMGVANLVSELNLNVSQE